MATETIIFRRCPATAKATFTCALCGKENRTRSFRVECTVNPFNCHDDGMPLSPSEVQQQSVEQANKERDEFMRKPACKACEDALTVKQRRTLRAKRKEMAAA